MKKQHMAVSPSRKFRISAGVRIWVKNPPDSFPDELSPLPDGVVIVKKPTGCSQLHWFVRNRAQLEKDWSNIRKELKPGLVTWVYFPKGSSGIQTDLSRDIGWDCIREEKGRLSWLTLVSYNDTWSAFGFRVKNEEEKPAKVKPVPASTEWIDPAIRIVRIPPDLEKAFKRHPKEAAYYSGLAYTHRKEYVEWIVSAKKPETRARRVLGTLERLQKKWKNPRNL